MSLARSRPLPKDREPQIELNVEIPRSLMKRLRIFKAQNQSNPNLNTEKKVLRAALEKFLAENGA